MPTEPTKLFRTDLPARERVGTHRHEPGFVNHAGHLFEMVGDPDRVLRCRHGVTTWPLPTTVMPESVTAKPRAMSWSLS